MEQDGNNDEVPAEYEHARHFRNRPPIVRDDVQRVGAERLVKQLIREGQIGGVGLMHTDVAPSTPHDGCADNVEHRRRHIDACNLPCRADQVVQMAKAQSGATDQVEHAVARLDGAVPVTQRRYGSVQACVAL